MPVLIIVSAPKNNYPPCQLTEWNQNILMHVHSILFFMWVHHIFNAMTKGTSGHILPMYVFTLMHSHMHAFLLAFFVAVRTFLEWQLMSDVAVAMKEDN
jgi:hypothetical protein